MPEIKVANVSMIRRTPPVRKNQIYIEGQVATVPGIGIMKLILSKMLILRVISKIRIHPNLNIQPISTIDIIRM